MLEHQKPFDSLREGRGSEFVDLPGFRVTLSNTGLLLLQSTSEPALQDALTSEIGLGIPQPQQASIRGDYALLWLSPAEWLLQLPPNEIDRLESALARRVASSLAVVTDMSDAFARCEVSGARAPETLMSGCSLDLHTSAFPAGCVARTALADIPAIIWKTEEPPPRFLCLVDRSLARHLLDWLEDFAHRHPVSSAQ